MSKNLFIALFSGTMFAAVFVSNYAEADEAWACAYKETDGVATSVQYTRNGDELIDRQLSLHYHILVDNEFGVIATSALAGSVTVGLWSVLIDKQSGRFQLAQARVGQTGLPISTGTCTQE